MDFQLLSNIGRIELDGATGWVRATRVSGEVFLIQPRDLLALAAWSQRNAQMLLDSQQAIDQEAAFYSSSVQGQARPVRLVDALPLSEDQRTPAATPRKRGRKPLPIPSIQISEALPCVLLCTTKTMTAVLDFGTGSYAPWLLYPLCEEHLRAVLAQREATGLSLRVIVEQLTRPAP